MLKNWQFNILFFVGVGGAILLLVGPEFGIDIGQNPIAFSGVGAILTYILTERKILTKTDSKKDESEKEMKNDG